MFELKLIGHFFFLGIDFVIFYHLINISQRYMDISILCENISFFFNLYIGGFFFVYLFFFFFLTLEGFFKQEVVGSTIQITLLPANAMLALG